MLLEMQYLESLPTPTSEDIDVIRQKQSELQTFRSTANEGRIIRSRAKWYEEGEKGSSSYFLKLERRNFESKLIPCLNTEDREAKSTSEILTVLSKHYENLYNKGENVFENEINDYLDSANLPKLSNVDSQQLEKDITVEELGETLMKF